MPRRFFGDTQDSDWRMDLLRRVLALFGLALVAATWRLWTPQTVFPQVPFFRWLAACPSWCQWIGLSAMVTSLTAMLIAPQAGRIRVATLLAFAASTAGMVLVDQLRLQPWVYQFVLLAIVLAVADSSTALALLRLFIVGFYFHSALSKLDYSFLHTLGQQFLSALVGCVGGSIADWSDVSRLAGAAVFPSSELLIAIGLCFPRTRRCALAGAILLHLLLLVILGPWGMNHKPGVLLWNLYFVFQNLLLFGASRHTAIKENDPLPSPSARWLPTGVVAATVLLPFLAPWSWYDLWPSWGLYASSAERIALFIHRRELRQLPEELQPYVAKDEDADEVWVTLRLDRWALDTLAAPIFPQSRFQLGVAEAVIAEHQLGNRARVVRFRMAARWTGVRQHDVLAGLPQIIAAGDEYYLNSRPRQAFSPTQLNMP